MRSIFLLFLLVLFAFPAFAADKGNRESAYDRVMRTDVLRCGFVPWPPGFEVDPNTNEIKGASKEVFESIIKLTGWKVEFVQTTLGTAVLDMNNGRIDAMCSDGPWTITNIKLVDYTTPALYTPVFIYVRAEERRFHSYKDMNRADVRLVGIDGDISSDLATLRFPKAQLQTLINLTDPAQMMLNVADGKADAVILDPVTGENFMKNNPGRVKALDVQEPLAVYPVMMSVRRGESLLQQTLSRATEMAINIGLNDAKLDLYDPARKIIYSPARPYEAPK